MAFSPVPDVIPVLPFERRGITEFNPPRMPGKHAVRPWPPSAEREWATDRHQFDWEMPDAAYDAMRAWVARVEAGEPDAMELAKAREVWVVQRNPAGKRDVLHSPEYVLSQISKGLHDEVFDDPEDRDYSNAGYQRRYEIRLMVAKGIIQEIFGNDVGDMIFWITEACWEADDEPCYDMNAQRLRAERRLDLGIANARDREIDAMGPGYWN